MYAAPSVIKPLTRISASCAAVASAITWSNRATGARPDHRCIELRTMRQPNGSTER